MHAPCFCRYVLRTTDVTAASRFYEGLQVAGDEIVELPAAAAARGAPAHWMGSIGVGDHASLDGVTTALIERGAARLGPRRDDETAMLRGPGGAVVALQQPQTDSRTPVVWHQLLTPDAADVARTYADLLGWALLDRVDLGEYGVHQPFAWRGGDEAAGSVVDITAMPGVHAHWLFHFAVADLYATVAFVRTSGGTALGPFDPPGGRRVAVCEDPQGAAFGLME